MKIPLFDIDGTLIKGFSGTHAKATEAAILKIYGIKALNTEIVSHGLLDPQILLNLLEIHGISYKEAKNQIKDALDAERAYIHKHISEAIYKPLPGAKALLDTLEREKAVVGTLTGNIEAAAKMKLASAGLWVYIDFGAFGEEAPSLKRSELVLVAQKKASKLLKRNIALNELVIIGDTPKDIFCAKEGGILSIGVGAGPYSSDELRAAGADLVVDTLEDQTKILSFLK